MKMVTSQDNKLIEGKLMKMKALKDSPAVQVGETFIGYYFNRPSINEGFIFFPSDRLGVPFQTTLVTKIIDEFTFETKNSVYYLIDKVRERDIKIEDILK
jgi:hypothetical protein